MFLQSEGLAGGALFVKQKGLQWAWTPAMEVHLTSVRAAGPDAEGRGCWEDTMW